jgi:hypothetical protein
MMNRRTLMASSVLAMLGGALIVYPVFAMFGGGHNTATEGKKIAAQFDQHKTTLAEAVTAAEEHTKGRAISVVSDVTEDGAVAVHVYCIAGDPPQILKSYFDHKTGTIKGVKNVDEFPLTPHAAAHTEHGQPEHADDHASAKIIKDQTMEVACGSCIYHMPGVSGCHAAVMIDGRPYLIEGATLKKHDFCERKVQALVSGHVEGDKFIATRLEQTD